MLHRGRYWSTSKQHCRIGDVYSCKHQYRYFVYSCFSFRLREKNPLKINWMRMSIINQTLTTFFKRNLYWKKKERNENSIGFQLQRNMLLCVWNNNKQGDDFALKWAARFLSSPVCLNNFLCGCVCVFPLIMIFEDLSNNARQLTVDTRRRKNNVIMTSKRRRDVVWTSQCRYCCLMWMFVAHGLAHTWDCDCLVFTVILSAQDSAVWWPCKSRFIVFYHLS